MLKFLLPAAICLASPCHAGGDPPEEAGRAVSLSELLAPPKPDFSRQPWIDPARSPDDRAELALAQMTLDEKIPLRTGEFMRRHLDGPLKQR